MLPFIDEDNKRLVVPALFEIISRDNVIDELHTDSFEKYVGVTKSTLLEEKNIILPELLAGILLNMVIVVKNTDGSSDAKEIDNDFVDQFRKKADEFHISEEIPPRTNENVSESPAPDETSVTAYMDKLAEKYGKIYTLINKYERIPFYSVFICNDIERKVPIQGAVDNTYRSEYIKDATATKLAAFSRYIIFSGTGGIGKSMMMRHLLFDSIKNYHETGVMPIFLLLKNFDNDGRPLLEHICDTVLNYSTGITKEQLIHTLEEGKCLILFDGLDEIEKKNRDKFSKLLEVFVDRFSNDQYIISSRPSRTFASYLRFTQMFIRPFTKEQALALIDKIEFRPDDPTIKQRFRKVLDERLFKSHKEFAENPLLLTIMLMTYEKYEDVPSKMHVFYRKAYDALAQEHDANKGYKRPLATGLSADDFAEYLAEFCALTYCDEKFELTKADVNDYFNRLNTLKRRRDPKATPENFITDLRDNLCLVYFENDKYHFTHRSFQEYFCAVCFSKQKDKDLADIGEIFENMRSRNYADKTFPMLYDMISAKIDEYMFTPFLERLFKECDAGDGYWTFLSIMYPLIEYEKGDTPDYTETAPVSYIYEFIRKQFFDNIYDFDTLPMEKSFVQERYVYIEDPVNGMTLVNENDIPAGYSDEYGYPDEAGWLLELAVDDIKTRRYRYAKIAAAIDDDDFCLKKEYKRARECLWRLSDNQKPTGSSILDRLI